MQGSIPPPWGHNLTHNPESCAKPAETPRCPTSYIQYVESDFLKNQPLVTCSGCVFLICYQWAEETLSGFGERRIYFLFLQIRPILRRAVGTFPNIFPRQACGLERYALRFFLSDDRVRCAANWKPKVSAMTCSMERKMFEVTNLLYSFPYAVNTDARGKQGDYYP